MRWSAILAAVLSLWALAAKADTFEVLWYTYAHPESLYVAHVRRLAEIVHTLPAAGGHRWRLAFFRPDDPAPAFPKFHVLVVHSAEPGFTARYYPLLGTMDSKDAYAKPDYAGILKHRAAIEAARGARTFLTGSDPDVHMIFGDTGNAPPDPRGQRVSCHPVITGPACWDGAIGHLVNAVNWAAAGGGLGIVSFVAGEYPGANWWIHPDSFLREELGAAVRIWGKGQRENAPSIPTAARDHPLNRGLTTRGLSNWNSSFHGGFRMPVAGYASIVDATRHPGTAVVIASERPGRAGARPARSAPAAAGAK